MVTVPAKCPSCDTQLSITKLRCDGCSTQLEGIFEIPPLLRLSPGDMDFLIRFVKASGSLKEMAHQYRQSYPTVRNRLNDIIGQLGDPAQSVAETRRSILEAIASGTMSAAEAERKLREVH